MRESRFGRFTVPDVTGILTDGGATTVVQPAILCSSGNRPLRVLVRNTSVGVVVFLALDQQALATLTEGPGGGTFELPAGMSETFVIAEEQRLYVAAAVVGGIVTFAISDALPTDIGDERRFSP